MDVGAMCELADIIEPVEGLTLSERYIFCQVPLNIRSDKSNTHSILRNFARQIADRKPVTLPDSYHLEADVFKF